jgi:hypothetical protein
MGRKGMSKRSWRIERSFLHIGKLEGPEGPGGIVEKGKG